MKRLFLILIFVFLPLRIDAKTIRMGFVGGYDIEHSVQIWSPLLDYLQRETGYMFEMTLREDYLGLIESLEKGDIDLYEGGAFSHVLAMERGKADILVGQINHGTTFYYSVFVVPAKASVETIHDVKGKRLALTQPLSTSGYLLPRLMLEEAGIENPKTFFGQIVLTGSHDRSLEALLSNSVDVVAVGNFFIEMLPEEKKNRLKIIRRYGAIPFGPVTVRKDLDSHIRQTIQNALLAFEQKASPDIRRITERDGFILQTENTFDIVRTYAAKAKKIPELTTSIPYQKIPTIVAKRIDDLKNDHRRWTLFFLGCLALLIIFFILVTRKRFTMFVVSIMVSTIFAPAGIIAFLQTRLLFGVMDNYAVSLMSRIENMNLRAVSSI